MGKISIVINVVDEEVDLLPRVLASVKDLVEEMVIVDMTSSNEVQKIGDSYKAKVFKHNRVAFVELARNFGISKASSEWILVLDPDEQVTPILADGLKKISAENKANFVRIPRKNIIFGKWMKNSRWWPDYNVRFFRKGNVEFGNKIHEPPVTIGKAFDLPAEENFAIVHNHYSSIEQYIERMNRYTSQHAKNLVNKGFKFNWKDLIKKPSDEFLSRYFFGKGYKDGVHGLALSLLQSFSEIVLYLKVWQSKKFEPKELNVKEVINTMRISELDLHYWQADSLLSEGGGILQKIKRKFRLP
ncbi:hypothetical protein A3A50_00070 [Candidatus Woesebacteria bacterium RIFCSPLOWO2_01_FULL_38_20]|nr:MAG: hypothetical protein A3A50_00070 [Candidatus Woesebacteria bacterium RIFCSPLOWO2_01_FULL_38_20]